MRPLVLLSLLACTDAGTTTLVGDPPKGPGADSPIDSPTDQDSDAPPADTDPPEQPPGAADPDVQTWTPPDLRPVAPVRLIFLGGSITAGFGVEHLADTCASLLQENNPRSWPGHNEID